jgi:hypothetical protein
MQEMWGKVSSLEMSLNAELKNARGRCAGPLESRNSTRVAKYAQISEAAMRSTQFGKNNPVWAYGRSITADDQAAD